MKVVGLITEYNPFHNGHLYHIKEAKRITGADYVVVVMSGNFVQRGTPAMIDKYSRTRMALTNGADIVFELPVCYATASAEFFALGAVSLLDKLGIVDDLCFGSECGDIQTLTSIAQVLLQEPKQYKEKLNDLLKNGKTFPTARMEALKEVIGNGIENTVESNIVNHVENISVHTSDKTLEEILSSPNNILGIEYIKAILRLNSKINPVTITRKIAGYHKEELTNHENEIEKISSATAIRKAIFENTSLRELRNHVPHNVLELLKVEHTRIFPIGEDDFTLLLNYKLLQETEKTLTSYSDVTRDLANRLQSIQTNGMSFQQIALKLKSRQWTLTRVNRVLLHILLNHKSDRLNIYNTNGYSQYARILGFRKTSSHLLRTITKYKKIPVITKMADAKKQLTDVGLSMLQEDINAAHLYNYVVFDKYKTLLKDEYKHGVVMF